MRRRHARLADLRVRLGEVYPFTPADAEAAARHAAAMAAGAAAPAAGEDVLPAMVDG